MTQDAPQTMMTANVGRDQLTGKWYAIIGFPEHDDLHDLLNGPYDTEEEAEARIAEIVETYHGQPLRLAWEALGIDPKADAREALRHD